MTRGGGVLGRALRTSSKELYAVADLGTARRLGALMWMLLAGRMFGRRSEISPDALLAASYVVLGLVAVLVWLAGSDAPQQELFLLSVLYTAAVHPPAARRLRPRARRRGRRAPGLRGLSSSLAAHIAGRLIVWCALGLMAMVFTGRVPSQRLGLLRHEASALARSDALTGLGNRRRSTRRSMRRSKRASRGDRPLGLIVADVDSFGAAPPSSSGA